MEFRDFVTKRLEEMRDRGPMYGDPVAVEGLAIQLIELETLHYFPNILDEKPRIVYRTYLKLLSQRTGLSTIPLSDPNRDPPVKDVPAILFDLCQKTRSRILEVIEAGVALE
jgi:hypothetical protein